MKFFPIATPSTRVIACLFFAAINTASARQFTPEPDQRASFPAPASIVPPPTLYHYGTRAVLVQDAQAETVPQDAWNTYIMGDNTTFGLLPFRRGLYGTSHPADSESFGDWLMAVHLQDRCRTPDAVVVPSYLLTDQRFSNWFTTHSHTDFTSIDDFAKQCFRPANDQYGAQSILQVQNVNMETDLVNGPCEALLQKFYVDQDIKIVLDEQWPEQDALELNIIGHISWYIRDRNCIQSIQSKPEEIANLLAQIVDPWRPACGSSDDSNETKLAHLNLGSWDLKRFSIFLTALSETPQTATASDLLYLKNQSAPSQITWNVDDQNSKKIGTVSLSKAVPEVVDAWQRCHDRKNFNALQNVLKKFFTERTVARPDGDSQMDVGTATANMIERLHGICQ